MKSILFAILFLLSACAGKEKTYVKATDALDAGREYINACMEGDFDRAAFYMVPDEKNRAALQGIENSYREKDKEGRQQLRGASININEVKNNSDSTAEIRYNNSFDKQPRTVFVVKQNGSWLVDARKN